MTWDILQNDEYGVLRLAMKADLILLERLTTSAQVMHYSLTVPELRALVLALLRNQQWYGLGDMLSPKVEERCNPVPEAHPAPAGHRPESVLEHCLARMAAWLGSPPREMAVQSIRAQLKAWGINPTAAYADHAQELAQKSDGAYPMDEEVWTGNPEQPGRLAGGQQA